MDDVDAVMPEDHSRGRAQTAILIYLTYSPEDVQCILVCALPRSREPFITFYRFSAGCLRIRFYHILLPSPPRHCV